MYGVVGWCSQEQRPQSTTPTSSLIKASQERFSHETHHFHPDELSHDDAHEGEEEQLEPK